MRTDAVEAFGEAAFLFKRGGLSSKLAVEPAARNRQQGQAS